MIEKIPFPEGWIEQLNSLLGHSLPDFLHSYDASPARGIRMRPGIKPPAEIEDPIPWVENGYYLPLDSLAGATPAHEAGAYYLQEPSAMAAAAALRPNPGEKVLDLCAAPGGKSTQLGAFLQGRGTLICNEPVPGRAQILARNIERMGIGNAIVVNHLPEELSHRWPGWFDKILVDAPCSGEGMFRRHPETRQEWHAASPAGCAQRQGHILSHAARMLRPGGIMAYSTCTFNPIENEGVIQGFLRDHPEFSLRPFALPGIGACQGMMRLWPHLIRGEGHFVALLQKAEDAPDAPVKKKEKQQGSGMAAPDKHQAALAVDFLREHFDLPLIPNALFANRITQVPECPSLQGVKVLRLGLHLGEAKGKIFIPDHALALTHPCKKQVEVDTDAARAYQNGQVLPCKEGLKGWFTLCLDGLSLGWGKASDGQMKNHYPKGLRK